MNCSQHPQCEQGISVGAVIVRDDKVLLLKRSDHESMPGLWELPGGKAECDEPIDETVRREVEEETGLCVTKTVFLSSFRYTIGRSGTAVHVLQLNFRARVTTPDVIRLSPEHCHWKFVEADDLREVRVSTETKQVVHRVLRVR